jgi:hypothetical protein
MLLPHKPSKHLQRARRRNSVAEADVGDVEVTDIPLTGERPTPPAARTRVSGRTAALNPRPPEPR